MIQMKIFFDELTSRKCASILAFLIFIGEIYKTNNDDIALV